MCWFGLPEAMGFYKEDNLETHTARTQFTFFFPCTRYRGNLSQCAFQNHAELLFPQTNFYYACVSHHTFSYKCTGGKYICQHGNKSQSFQENTADKLRTCSIVVWGFLKVVLQFRLHSSWQCFILQSFIWDLFIIF